MKLRKIGEQNNMKDIEYKEVNGYLFPNLKVPEDVKVNSYFARMKVKYLKKIIKDIWFR